MIIGLDTATASTAVAVWAPGGPEIERRDDPPLGLDSSSTNIASDHGVANERRSIEITAGRSL